MPPEDNTQEESKNTTNPDTLGNYEIPTLRTYKNDIQNVVKTDDISSTRILLEEQRRKTGETALKEEQSISSGRNKNLLILGLVLILLAGGTLGIIWFYPKIQPKNDTIIKIERPAFFEADGQTLIPTELRTKRSVLSDFNRMLVSAIPEKTIEEIIFSEQTIEETETGEISRPQPITTSQFLELVESRASDTLIRSLQTQFMIGLHETKKVNPFILFKIQDFDNAYPEMLRWESTLSRDLQPIFFTNITPEILSRPRIETTTVPDTSATSSATTSAPVTRTADDIEFDPTIFKDRVILNTDARAIIDDSGNIVLFYTFINNDHLVITNSAETLAEIIRRLKQSKLIR